MNALHVAAEQALAALAHLGDPAASAARSILQDALNGCAAASIRPAARPGWTPTLAIDFDDVLCQPDPSASYAGPVIGEPVPGAAAGLRQVMACFCAVVHTCRPPATAAAWISARLAIPALADTAGRQRTWTTQGLVLVTQRKIPALAYLDDRALPFTDWERAVRAVLGLLPHRPEPDPASPATHPDQEAS